MDRWRSGALAVAVMLVLAGCVVGDGSVRAPASGPAAIEVKHPADLRRPAGTVVQLRGTAVDTGKSVVLSTSAGLVHLKGISGLPGVVKAELVGTLERGMPTTHAVPAMEGIPEELARQAQSSGGAGAVAVRWMRWRIVQAQATQAVEIRTEAEFKGSLGKEVRIVGVPETEGSNCSVRTAFGRVRVAWVSEWPATMPGRIALSGIARMWPPVDQAQTDRVPQGVIPSGLEVEGAWWFAADGVGEERR